ncbi:hypothetical protein BC834DRAFT_975049 [Gloeopeniophorella convolvens]|nr:hypothetical protein BC834DRAFT_975049 [Gloeopeniophorella convolvens]
MKAEPQPGIRTPSANRLSISYAAGTKRLVINAEIDDSNELKGIIIEGLSEATKSYSSLETLSPTVDSNPTVPPFSKAAMPSEVTLLVHLNTERPLSGPKWIKSGDVQDWLKSTFGHMFWVVGDAAEGWEKKIEVADPDPAPTIWTVLDGWAVNPPVGLHTERQGLHYVLWLQDIVAHSRGVHNSDTAAVHDIDRHYVDHSNFPSLAYTETKPDANHDNTTARRPPSACPVHRAQEVLRVSDMVAEDSTIWPHPLIVALATLFSQNPHPSLRDVNLVDISERCIRHEDKGVLATIRLKPYFMLGPEGVKWWLPPPELVEDVEIVQDISDAPPPPQATQNEANNTGYDAEEEEEEDETPQPIPAPSTPYKSAQAEVMATGPVEDIEM